MAKKKTHKTPVESNIIDAMNGRFTDWFPGDTWDAWKVILKAAYGMPLSDDELAFFDEVAGGRAPPTKRVRELWVIGGRRGGKDSIASLIIAHAAALFDGKRRQIAGITLPALRRGERATVFTIAKDRDQARIALDYVRSYFSDIPELAAMIVRETRDGFELANGCSVVIGTSDYKSLRGRAILCAILDEVAFFKDQFSALPDTELYNAITPGMLTLRDQAMLIGISTPHKKSGLLWDKYQKCFGHDDPDVLVIRATSTQLNPTLPVADIEAEIATDPELKRAEYLCEWRTDISSFVSPEIVDAATMKARQVLSPADESYTAFVDFSGGVRDSHTLAVAFKDDATGAAVLACAREVKSSDTEAVAAEFAALLKSYSLGVVYGDRYGAEWTRSAFDRHGVELRKSPYDRSDLYLNLLPALNSGQVKLLDLPRLRQQLLALERRTIRGTARDVVDHPSAGADDLVNSCAGALVMAATADSRKIAWSIATDHSSWASDAGRQSTVSDYPYRSEVFTGPGCEADRWLPPIDRRMATNIDFLRDGACREQQKD